MFLSDLTQQKQLFAFTVRDLVPEDSDVWLYVDIFGSINLEPFDWSYSNEGQHPIDPRLMLQTIFYGLTHGVVSGHKMETACRNDNRFVVLSGDRRPDRRTFDRFIRRHHDRIEALFVDSVKLAQAMGLVKLGRVALDGSRFKGQTSKERAMVYEKMERAMGYIQEELEKLRQDLAQENSGERAPDDRLPKEIKNKERRLARIEAAKKQIEKEHAQNDENHRGKSVDDTVKKSLNDPEALSLDSRGKTFMYGYNAQAVVDDHKQIVVAADLHDKASDYEALPKMLDQLQANCGEQAKEILADLGYKSGDNILAIESRGAVPYVATTSDENATADVKFSEQVTSTGQPHQYRCMAGKTLTGWRCRSGGTEVNLGPKVCADCPFALQCKAYGKKRAEILEEARRAATVRLTQRSRTDAYKEVYRRRKAIVEPVFGNIKNKGMTILVKGRGCVSLWWRMACTAHNLEKIARNWKGTPAMALS